jgi:hypothetical protein
LDAANLVLGHANASIWPGGVQNFRHFDIVKNEGAASVVSYKRATEAILIFPSRDSSRYGARLTRWPARPAWEAMDALDAAACSWN